MAEEGYFRPRNGAKRGWLVTIVAAVIAALLVPSISAVIIVSQMHQKQKDFASQLMRQRADFKEALKEHDNEACHGSVCTDLVELRTLAKGQADTITGLERSLQSTNRANDRLSDRITELQRSIRNRDSGAR